MLENDDARDPLRYMKAEMAKKFGNNLTFGNNLETLGPNLPPHAAIQSIKDIIQDDRILKQSKAPTFARGTINSLEYANPYDMDH